VEALREWVGIILNSDTAEDADQRLGAEAEKLQGLLAGDLTLHEALEVQRLTSELESLRADLRRTVRMRHAPEPPEGPEDEPGPDEPENGPVPAPTEEAPAAPPSESVVVEVDVAALVKAEEAPQAPPPEARRPFHNFDFLGRGVSGRLSDHRGDPARLANLGLPALESAAHLAGALRVSMRHLRWLAFHNEVATRIHYVHFRVPKKSGGTRTLSAPHRMLGRVLHWLHDNLVSKLPPPPACHGFVAGRSIVSNALVHAGQALVVNLDLEGFFPSIGFPRVRKVFERAGYSPALATVLGLLCTECPRRPVE
jgi:hypothetical protein